MKGAICGDVIGSFRENLRIKTKDFDLLSRYCFFTDDTVLTVAVADALLRGDDFGGSIRRYARRRPFRGYGPKFIKWMWSPRPRPYQSFGNGSAMRVSPVAYVGRDEGEVLHLAKRSAECTHDHPDGIAGAQAVALAVFMAKNRCDIPSIKSEVSGRFGYDLSRPLDSFRKEYRFSMTCQGSVPEALIAFFESTDVEDAIRNAVSLGGDADTQASIACAIAEPFYAGVPRHIEDFVTKKLPSNYVEIIDKFTRTFCFG